MQNKLVFDNIEEALKLINSGNMVDSITVLFKDYGGKLNVDLTNDNQIWVDDECFNFKGYKSEFIVGLDKIYKVELNIWI